MKKQAALLLLITLCYNITYSQYVLKNQDDINWYKNIPQEKVFINTNNSLLLTGESLYYKVYCFNSKTNTLSNNSKIAYIELVGSKNRIFKQKIKLINGIGTGDFLIPTSINSGNYKLLGYTQWMKNGSVTHFFQADIKIVNPYKENESIATLKDSVLNLDKVSLKITKEKIKLKTNAEFFESRKKVVLTINGLENSSGNYSVLVRKKPIVNNVFNTVLVNDFNNILGKEKVSIGESIYLPEFLGEMITGQVINKKIKKTEVNKEIVLSILSDEMHQDIVKTNTQGVFYFHLKDDYSKSNAIVQVLGDDRINYKIEINNHKSIDYNALKFDEFNLSNELKEMIVERSIHNQIQNAYYTTKQDTLLIDNYLEPFFGNYSTIYFLDDFKRFPTIEETLVEIIGHVWSRRGKKGSRVIDVRELEFDPYYGLDISPMLIIDGVFVQDHQSVLDFDARKVESVAVYRQEYYYGKRVYQGILLIKTFDNNYADYLNKGYLKKIALFKPEPKKIYFNQMYSNDLKTKTGRIPDFREQLLWYPDFKLNKNNINLEFFTSDVKGTFEIILKGFTNQGIPISVKKNIIVK